MKKYKIIVSLLVCLSLITVFSACSQGEKNKNENKVEKITVAYQGGIGYAPVHIMEKLQLIEKNYGKNIEVSFTKLDSGAAINEGIIGGTVQVGCMGISPAISAVAAGVPCRVISNLCSQSHGLMSNTPGITKLSDITAEDKIGLVNTGSIQHILLAMAAEKELNDAHALDNNIQAMAHAEGMAALESGTVKLHLTSSPFIELERESGKYTELNVIDSVWEPGNSFLVASAATSLSENNPELFKAVQASFKEAIDFLNNEENAEKVTEIESEYLALDKATTQKYLQSEDCRFFSELKGGEKMIDFMYRAGFITNKITINDLVYEGVKGN